MKKNEVKIGGVYVAKVSDRITEVRIDSTNTHGGWNATNIRTGKRILVKSAQRLRCRASAAEAAGRAAGQRRARPDAAPRPNHQVRTATVDAPAAETRAVDQDPATPPAQSRRSKKAAGDPQPKRLSAINAAAQILQEAGRPLRAKEMIEAMAERGLWSSPKGQTPEATLYASIIREIKVRGDQARFRKTERGRFASAGGVV